MQISQWFYWLHKFVALTNRSCLVWKWLLCELFHASMLLTIDNSFFAWFLSELMLLFTSFLKLPASVYIIILWSKHGFQKSPELFLKHHRWRHLFLQLRASFQVEKVRLFWKKKKKKTPYVKRLFDSWPMTRVESRFHKNKKKQEKWRT